MLQRIVPFRLAMQTQTTQTGVRHLPRLPVPDLHQTLQKYLTSLEPFLLEDEARGDGHFAEGLGVRAAWAQEFEQGIGRVCQERLVALDRSSPNNWLDDNIWMKKAYHEWRAPLIVNSNWWLAFHNDANVPEDVICGRAAISECGATNWQVRRAAWLVHRILDWKLRLARNDIGSDTTRQGVWLRDTTAQMFNIARLPRPQCDTLSELPSPTSEAARNILVMLRDWFYTVEVFDSSLQPIAPAKIERRLRAVVADVTARLGQGEEAVPVGVLTADDRDRWAENSRHLLSLSPINHSTLRKINHSLFALCLDHYTYVLPPSPPAGSASPPFHTSALVHSAPLPKPCTVPELTAHLHNVRSGPSYKPAHNRWFDKPFSLIVESNTRAGAMGEHSPCDALVPSIIADYAVVQGVDADAFPPIDSLRMSEQVEEGVDGWQRLEWVVDERIVRECEEAEAGARMIVEDSDDGILWFDAFGAEWIKGTARFSPDAYIQMAMQLAWYRTRGCFTATYETTLTRLFSKGRTETIRTLTKDSRAFVLAMDDPNVTTRERHALLRRAIQTHTNLTRQAATGRGIDRHLLGLRLMLRAGESHELFEDELFTRSQTWKLSTSGLSAGEQFRGTGFGAPYPDGYGINYMAGPEVIKFGIGSKFSSSLTSTEGFKTAISQALLDMKILCIGPDLVPARL
ncbi:acyltransferase ChoActase/COT/CPT [Wolfiporia cocos MD-104 SS10]|uniref:Acyltransferase ChoActase/COT/CPT n=1 Tax=Wolfiporia cocos (strain MD-104) TaxID=742152 RepID=A0A2H3JX22_WOLCO|nr:acyltransferase ChoActase/COT/CPT [Wolfiporia cocos MD-104 SS10]